MFAREFLPASTAALIFTVLALFAFVALCLAHFQLRGHRHWGRSLVMYGFWLFGLIVALLIVLPLPEITPDFCYDYRLIGAPQTEPFDFIGDIARHSGFTRGRFSVRAMVGSAPFLLAVANFAAFIPLGIYVRWFTRRGVLVAALAGFAVSLAFEVTQGTALFGLYPCPYRHFNVDDLMLNTAGAVAGYIAAVFAGAVYGVRRALHAETTG